MRLSLLLATVLTATATAPAAASAAGSSTVSGTVVVPAGADASRVQVLLLDTAGSEVASATVTDNHSSTTTGTYAFSSVANGTYELYYIDPRGSDDVAPGYLGGSSELAGASAVTITSNYTVPTVTLASGGEISGTFTDLNSGDSPVLIVACQVGAPDPAQAAYWGSAGDGSFSDGKVCEGDVPASGGFSFGGLVPGANYTLLYTFDNTAHGWTDRYLVDGSSLTADTSAATDFTAPTGAGLATSFSVPALGSISGVVTDPEGLNDTAFGVQLVDAAGTVLSPSVAFANGGYTIAGLLPGSYQVEFLPTSSMLAPQYYAGAATLAAATPVSVNGGVTPNINVTLAPAAAISGTVTAAQGGAAVGGLEVDVIDADGNVVGSAFTNTDGTYSIPGLPAGTWYLRVDGGRAHGGVYYATLYYGGSSTLAGSAPLVLTAGENLIDVNQAVLVQSTAAAGVPTETGGALSGLHDNRVALRFKLASGAGAAGYLKSFRIKLPKHFSWSRKHLAHDLVVTSSTAGDAYTDVIESGELVVTFASGTPGVSVDIKAGGITVTRAIEARAKARKLASETISLSATDATGLTTSLSFAVVRPR